MEIWFWFRRCDFYMSPMANVINSDSLSDKFSIGLSDIFRWDSYEKEQRTNGNNDDDNE